MSLKVYLTGVLIFSEVRKCYNSIKFEKYGSLEKVWLISKVLFPRPVH